jgi:hypothetical protein
LGGGNKPVARADGGAITASAWCEVIPTEPSKLLEVNENTVESGVMPLSFGPMPTRGINFSSTIIEVTPDELRRIQSRELRLPDGWEIREELPRPVEHPEGRDGGTLHLPREHSFHPSQLILMPAGLTILKLIRGAINRVFL